MVRRLLHMLVMAVAYMAAAVGSGSPAGPVDVPSDAFTSAYVCSTTVPGQRSTYTTCERGPPAAGANITDVVAVDLGSSGSSTRPGESARVVGYTYDVAVQLVQLNDVMTSITEVAEAIPGDLSSPEPARVAAKSEGYLYRGVHYGHPAYDDAAHGTVRPWGGHSDPALHNGGNNQSVFTSWTTDESIARDIANEANGPGIVLRIPNVDGPGHVRVPSPDIYGESEVLIRGPVFGAGVLP